MTGLVIDCVAVLALCGYSLYYIIKKKEPDEPRHHFWMMMLTILCAIFSSLCFFYAGDIDNASVLAWVAAVPVILTTIFIILMIIFRPGWD